MIALLATKRRRSLGGWLRSETADDPVSSPTGARTRGADLIVAARPRSGHASDGHPRAGAVAGLLLLRTVRTIEKPVIVAEARAGVSPGDLALLVPPVGSGGDEMKIEPNDDAGSLEPGGRMRRWRVGDLLDGVYVARSVGSGGVASTTFFEVVEAEVRRVFGKDRRKAERALRRR